MSALDAAADHLYVLLAASTTSQEVYLARVLVSDGVIDRRAGLQGQLGLGLVMSLVVPDETTTTMAAATTTNAKTPTAAMATAVTAQAIAAGI